MILKINGEDFSHIVKGFKVGYETLVSDNSGRNASGNTVIDVINHKKKLYVELRHTTQAEMQAFLEAIAGFEVSITYFNPQAGTAEGYNILCYTGTPEPELYTKQGNHIIYKPMSINFIEL